MVLLPAHGSELQITSVLPRPLSLQTGVLTRLDQVFFLDTHLSHKPHTGTRPSFTVPLGFSSPTQPTIKYAPKATAQVHPPYPSPRSSHLPCSHPQKPKRHWQSCPFVLPSSLSGLSCAFIHLPHTHTFLFLLQQAHRLVHTSIHFATQLLATSRTCIFTCMNWLASPQPEADSSQPPPLAFVPSTRTQTPLHQPAAL